MTFKDLPAVLVDSFSATVSAGMLQKFLPSDQHIEHFHQFGFVSGICVVDEQTVDDLRSQLKELFDPDHKGERAVPQIAFQ